MFKVLGADLRKFRSLFIVWTFASMISSFTYHPYPLTQVAIKIEQQNNNVRHQQWRPSTQQLRRIMERRRREPDQQYLKSRAGCHVQSRLQHVHGHIYTRADERRARDAGPPWP